MTLMPNCLRMPHLSTRRKRSQLNSGKKLGHDLGHSMTPTLTLHYYRRKSLKIYHTFLSSLTPPNWYSNLMTPAWAAQSDDVKKKSIQQMDEGTDPEPKKNYRDMESWSDS